MSVLNNFNYLFNNYAMFCVFLVIQMPQHLLTSPLRSSVQSKAVTLFSRQRQCQATAVTGSAENIDSTYDRNGRRSTVAVSCTVAATRGRGLFILQRPSITLPRRRIEHHDVCVMYAFPERLFWMSLMTIDAYHRIM